MDSTSGHALAAMCGASTAIVVGVALWAWHRRGRVPAAGAFAGLSAAQALWNLGHLFEVLSRTLPGKLLWDSLQYLPYGALAPAALYTAARYHRVPMRRARAWAWAVGAMSLPMAAAVGALRLFGVDGYVAHLAGSPPRLVYAFGGSTTWSGW
jgi:hypothetical protein